MASCCLIARHGPGPDRLRNRFREGHGAIRTAVPVLLEFLATVLALSSLPASHGLYCVMASDGTTSVLSPAIPCSTPPNFPILPTAWHRDLGQDRKIEIKRPDDMSPEPTITQLPSNRFTNNEQTCPLPSPLLISALTSWTPHSFHRSTVVGSFQSGSRAEFDAHCRHGTVYGRVGGWEKFA